MLRFSSRTASRCHAAAAGTKEERVVRSATPEEAAAILSAANKVVIVPGYGRATVDMVADQPGLTLFHCHIQQHMDYGFKALFRYAQ